MGEGAAGVFRGDPLPDLPQTLGGERGDRRGVLPHHPGGAGQGDAAAAVGNRRQLAIVRHPGSCFVE